MGWRSDRTTRIEHVRFGAFLSCRSLTLKTRKESKAVILTRFWKNSFRRVRDGVYICSRVKSNGGRSDGESYGSSSKQLR